LRVGGRVEARGGLALLVKKPREQFPFLGKIETVPCDSHVIAQSPR